MGASQLERVEPHGGSPGQENYFMARWTFRWEPAWDWKGSTYVEAQHWAANGQLKVNRATQQECAEPHRQFTGIDDIIERANSTEGPHGCHQGRQHTNHTGFGAAVLNCT